MSNDHMLGNAPYATAPTSIIVYKGRGILVRRARDLQGAIVDAIEEFGLQQPPSSVYISAYIGQQGQEVIVSRSAFAFVRDTIPLHVHVREEDVSKPQSELARWPAPPMQPLPVNMFGPVTQFTLRKPAFNSAPNPIAIPPLPSALPLAGGQALTKTPSTQVSKMESISDWRKTASGTPDTAPSMHHHFTSHPTVSESPQEMLPSQSPEESRRIVEEHRLQAHSKQGDVASVIESSSNNVAKPWNWFKKAVRGASATPPESETSPPEILTQPINQAGLDKVSQVTSSNGTRERPAASQQQSSVGKRSSRQVAQDIKKILNEPREGASALAQQDSKSRSRERQAVEESSASETWGPGGLVLDDGADAHASAGPAKQSQHLPWWARPPDAAFDMGTKQRNKLGLKPLKLGKSDQSSTSASNASEAESDAGTHKHTEKTRPRIERERSGSPTPKGVVMHLSSPGSAGSQDMYYRKPAATQASERAAEASRTRAPSGEPRREENHRPLPADIPESPASNRRFTRAAEQLDVAPSAPRQTTKSRKRSQHDVVPVVPVAKSKYGRPARQAKASVSSINDFPTTPDSSEPEVRPAALARRPSRRKKSTVDIRAAVPVALPEKGRVITERPVKTVVKSVHEPPKATVVPEVPIALPASTAEKTGGASGSGTFAAALVAARRQMTRKDTLPESTTGSSRRAEQATRRHIQKRSSLASLRDYVPAILPAVREDKHDSQSIVSDSSSLLKPPSNLGRAGSVQSRDSYAANSVDTIFLDRLVLGPMDITSPNRKGSQLVMRAVPALSQIVLEWQAEKKTVLSLAFDALSAVQLPGPDCPYTFVLFQVRFGEAREVLLEMSEENLVHFQRFILILIAGAGANLDHLSGSAYERLVEAHGW